MGHMMTLQLFWELPNFSSEAVPLYIPASSIWGFHLHCDGNDGDHGDGGEDNCDGSAVEDGDTMTIVMIMVVVMRMVMVVV